MSKFKGVNLADYERVKSNLSAIRDFNNGDLSAINRYTGWGGLREAIYTKSVFLTLKKELGLSDDDINSIKKTFCSAYYTPSYIVKMLWQLIELNTEKPPRRILEPAVGTGAFLEAMPKSWLDGARVDAIELDTLTARMCQARFPSVNVEARGFEDFHPADPETAGYDLVIGNPPFGRQKLVDLMHHDLQDVCIHHYFVAKSFRLLNVGGLLAMVLPSFFMDNKSKHVRDIICQEGGELVTAFRLPDNCFSDATVTVDLVLIRKLENGQNTNSWTSSRKWGKAGKTDFINSYFLDNPRHVLGELAMVPMYDRHGITCRKTTCPEQLFKKVINSHVSAMQFDTLTSLDETIESTLVELKKMQTKLDRLQTLKAQFVSVKASIKAILNSPKQEEFSKN